MRRTIHFEACAKTQGERHSQNFRRLRRAEVPSSLRSQNTFFSRLAALAGSYFPNLIEIDHLFGFWVGGAHQQPQHGARSKIFELKVYCRLKVNLAAAYRLKPPRLKVGQFRRTLFQVKSSAPAEVQPWDYGRVAGRAGAGRRPTPPPQPPAPRHS